MLAFMDAPHDQPSDPRVSPDPYVSLDGMSLLWIDTILLVPAIFGVMFLPSILRIVVLSGAIGMAVAFGILYSWARMHPAGSTAHILDLLHIGPRRTVSH